MSANLNDDYEMEVHEEIVQEDGPVPVDRHERVEVVRDRGLEQRERIVEDRGAARYATLFQLTNIVWLLTGMLEFLLLVRMGLRLIGANPAAPFVTVVYRLSDLFLWPFYGMIGDPAVNNMVLEINTLIAMIVYAFLAWIVVRIINMVTRPTPTTAHQVHIERHQEY